MYKYTKESLFDNPINYSYSSYEGDHFLKEWENHRSTYYEELMQRNKSNKNALIAPELPDILTDFSHEIETIVEEDSCNLLLHKYESTKKIYSKYINNKPVQSSGCKNIEDYISTAFLIELFYSKTKDIRYLNCLLKLCDLFQSDKKFLLYSFYIKELISKESMHVLDLLSEKSNLILNEYKNSEETLKIYKNPKTIKGLILICCNSSRSSIYLQSLINANIYPEHIIYMSGNKAKEKSIRYPYKKLNCSPDWLFVPEEYIHPKELAKENNINFILIETGSINSDVIYNCLSKITIKLIIYCGFGGEIVSQELIKSYSFIHCHAGALPRFKGSTTFYYEILSKNQPSVSCIILDETIDTGPILAIKSFPIPFKTDNIDSLYEPSIRANLLCDVLFKSGISLNLKPKQQLNEEKQLNYYIIHPVLKHVSYAFFKNSL